MSFRQHAPETKAVTSFRFPEYKQYPIGKNMLYAAPRRDLGVLKLSLYWPQGTAVQPSLFLARTASELRLKGTKTRCAEDILKGFEMLGASADADTGLMHSSITLKARTEVFEEALKWLLENIEDSDYPEKELETFKQIEIAGLQRRMQTPRYWSQRLCMENLYGSGSPDASFSNPEDIQNVKREDALGWCKEKLAAGGATLFLSGDAGEKETGICQALFSGKTPGGLISSPTTGDQGFSPITEKVLIHAMEHANQVSMYWAKNINSLTMKEMHTASLVNMFLGGFFGSRLMQELREERGLTYGIGSMLSLSTQGYTWYVAGEMNSTNAAAAQEATAEIMHSLVSNPPTGDELHKAKSYYSGQLRGGFDGPFSLPTKWQFMLQTGYSEEYYNTALDHIWSVSTDDICAFADNFLRPDTFTKALAGAVNY